MVLQPTYNLKRLTDKFHQTNFVLKNRYVSGSMTACDRKCGDKIMHGINIQEYLTNF